MESLDTPLESKRRRKRSLATKICFLLFLAVFVTALGFYIRFTTIYSYHGVAGPSMWPTYNEQTTTSKEVRDKVYVRKNAILKHGDEVVFEVSIKNQNGIFEDKIVIKRVIALEGDVVEIIEDNGEYKLMIKYAGADEFIQPDEPYLAEGISMQKEYSHWIDDYYGGARDGYKLTVGEGEFFALGDNRENSTDGSSFGAVSLEKVKGRVDFVVKYEWNGFKKVLYNFKIKFIIKSR